MNTSDHPRLASAMTAFPYSVDIDDQIEVVVELMQAHDIRHVPVTSGDAVVGVITDRDIKAAQRLLPDLQSYPVRTACEDEVYLVDINSLLSEVLRGMSERHIGSAVVTRQDKLVGIFTLSDACRAFAEDLERRDGRDDGPDEAA